MESRSSLAVLSGVRITSVEIVSESPTLPGAARLLNVLHPVSQEDVIRRQLLFAPGDTIDSLLVGETLRRLRAQRLFSDAVILARRCDATGGVGLTVRTRDTWTLRPTARLRAGNQLSIGFEDRNFLGSGRTVAVTREMSVRGNGAAATFGDPFFLGTSTAASLRLANLAGAHAFRLGLRQHEYSIFDRWRVEGSVARLSYGDTVVTERALHTINAMTMVGREISQNEVSVTHALTGIEFDSAATILATAHRTTAPGMPHVRSFLGLDLGLARRTAQFDTASWIVPGRGFLDVPKGWEGEAVLSAGEERDVGGPAFKYDLWTGRVWMPSRGKLVMLDGWASAYRGRDVDLNEITRASLMYRAEAWRGMWGLRVTAEKLAELDPDRRGLSLMPLADYTAPMLGALATRGGRTIAGSVDRDIRVMRVGAASVLNVGGFFASSYRWDVSDPTVSQLAAGVLGTRLRILSANGTVGSIRMDVGFPVFRSAVLPSKPYLVISYGSLFDASRQRDGRRAY